MINCMEMRPVPESFVWRHSEVLNSTDCYVEYVGLISVNDLTLYNEQVSCGQK
jgi:hypothetical protein